MDLQSLAAYSQANGVVINNLYVKEQIRKLSKDWLAPSRTIQIMQNVHEAIPVKLERLANNPKTVGKEIDIVFAGRMTGTRNFREIAELFRQQFAFPIGKKGIKTNFIVSTHSLSTGAVATGEIDFIDIQKNTRDQFWALLKKKAHVVINLSDVEDFSLSTYEPLLFGVPVIVPEQPWTSFLGPDYPFRVADYTEAYALLKEFTVNYDALYKQFREWEAKWWSALVASERNKPTVDVVDAMLEAFDLRVKGHLVKSDGGDFYKRLIDQIEQDGLTEVDAMAYANKRGIFTCPNISWRQVPVGRRPNMYLMKRYMNLAGWKDTLEPGVFVR